MSAVLVLDASAALEAVLGRSGASRVLDLIEGAGTVRAPNLYAAEVGNALWKHVQAGDLALRRAQNALEAALDVVDEMIPSEDIVHEALATAEAFGHPVYDALYLVAARRSGATVCTRDRRLASLLQEARVSVELI